MRHDICQSLTNSQYFSEFCQTVTPQSHLRTSLAVRHGPVGPSLIHILAPFSLFYLSFYLFSFFPHSLPFKLSFHHWLLIPHSAVLEQVLGDKNKFPGGPVGEDPPCKGGDLVSIPGWETNIPHAEGQLSPYIATTETHVLWSPWATARGWEPHKERSHMVQQRFCVPQKTLGSQIKVF